MRKHNEEQGNWFGRHKVLTVILALLVIGAIATATSSPSSNTENVSSNGNTSKQKDKTTESKDVEKVTISNSVVQDKGYGIFGVAGEVTNNDNVKHSATLKATFYDADGKILGTASGAVNDVASGETKTFDLMTTDKVASYKNMKVQVDTLL